MEGRLIEAIVKGEDVLEPSLPESFTSGKGAAEPLHYVDLIKEEE